MFIIFYRDGNGKITSHHTAPEDWTEQELAGKIEQYNSEKEKAQGRTAAYLELKDGSIERYLFDYLEQRNRYTKETIEAALDALDEARSCIDSLEVAK